MSDLKRVIDGTMAGQVVIHGANNFGHPRLRVSFISDANPPTAGWVGFDEAGAQEFLDALTAALETMRKDERR